MEKPILIQIQIQIITLEAKNKSKNNNSKKEPDPVDEKDIVVLTDDNFDSTVFKDDNMWMVVFFATWCGHCKKLFPELAQVATQLRGQVKLQSLIAKSIKNW